MSDSSLRSRYQSWRSDPLYKMGGPLLIVLVAFTLIYWPLFGAESLRWDDDHNVFVNPFFLTQDWLGFWRAPYFGLYVPVINSIWAALHVIGDGAVWPFRVLNFGLHALNIGLVFVLLKAFCRHFEIGASRWVLLFGLSVFALHPLQMGAVAWISGGRDLLATTFALSASLIFFRLPGWRGLGLGGVIFLLGLLSKPQIATLPLALVLYVVLFKEREARRRDAFGLALWMVLSVGVAFITYREQSPDLLWEIPFWFRPVVMLDTYGFYISKILFSENFGVDYGRTPISLLERPLQLWWTLPIVLGSLGVIAWGFHRDRRYVLAAAWFVLLLPVSGAVTFGFQQHSTVVDHYNYLPLIVVSILAVLIGQSLARRTCIERLLLGLIALILMSDFVMDSRARVRVWSSNERFFRGMLESNAESFMGHLGVAIIECGERGRPQEGIRLTERALEMRPSEVMAIGTLVNCLFKTKQFADVVDVVSRLKSPSVIAGLRKNEVATASILATIGSAHFNLGEQRKAFDFLCQAYWRNGVEQSIQARFFIVYERLALSGGPPECQPRLDIEDFLAAHD